MQTSPPQKSEPNCIQAVMQKQHALQSIVKKINLIQLAQEILTQVLPDNLIEHCQVANIQDMTLTLTTSASTWATHLRYYHQPILKALQNSTHFKQIQKLRLRTQPATPPTPKKNAPLKMSQEVSQTITATADSVKNLKLKEALNRLARHSG